MSIGPVKCICHDDIIPQNEAEVVKDAEAIKKTLYSVTEKQQQLSIDLSSGKLQGAKEKLAALAIQIDECCIRIKQGFEQLPFIRNISCWKAFGELKQISYRERKNNTYMSRSLIGTKEKVKKEIEPELSTRVTTSYLQSLKDVPLDTKRCFKTEIWFFSWQYPTTYQIIVHMQQTAKVLQKIEAEVEDKICKIWQGEFLGLYPQAEAPSLRACLKILKQNLIALQNQLGEIDSSAEAGVSYATALFAWIDAIERRIAFLAKSSENPRLQVGHVQQLLYLTLSKPSFPQLYTTIQALQELSSEPEDRSTFFEAHKTHVITAVKSALVLAGKNLLALSEQEQQIEKMILARKGLTGCSDTALKDLLLKKIIHHLHFTRDEFNISLDLLLTTLETRAEYEKIWKTIQNDNALAQHLRAYKEQSAFDQDKEVLSRVNDIVFCMNKTSKTVSEHIPAQTAYIFDHYALCQQLLYEIERIPASQQTKNRLHSALAPIEGLFSAITSKYNYPDYYSDLRSIVIPEVSELEKIDYIFP
ncbi:MAG: hypothetical protein JSR46_06150, partial [Verrucomicrobia bacterium]|nr:hypothetical protein [Verrucomicrobiota bacterium]